MFGDNHTTAVAPDWVRANLAELRSSGVTQLFMEIPERNQPIIEQFYAGAATEQDLRDNIGGLNSEAFVDLIVASRQAGIRVTAMDVNYTIPDNYRLSVANAHWQEIIEHTMEGEQSGSRFVVLAGMRHTDKSTELAHRGIDAMLGVPSIDIYDNQIATIEDRYYEQYLHRDLFSKSFW